MNNKNLIAVLIILAVVALVAYPRLFGKKESGIKFVTDKAGMHDIVSDITASGTLNPVTTIEVAATTGGTIKNIYADYNDKVSAGDPLAEIDTLPLENELKRSEADFAKARSELNLASSVLKTNKELYEKRLISREELENSQKNYSSANAAYEQYGVALDIAKANLENAAIRSPIDGVVLSRNLVKGERVLPNSKTLFVIAQDLSEMIIETNVNEADIGKVEKGQRSYFTVDAYPYVTFEGKVTQIINEPQVKNGVVTYVVLVSTGNSEGRLKPGMTAEVTIIVADRKDVLSVPTAAVRFIPPSNADIVEPPESNSLVVWVPADNGGIEALPVEIGDSDQNFTEIVSGLEQGQEVIVEAIPVNDPDTKSEYLPQPRRF